jgi:DNA-binding IclR family transcriptional regulator
MKSQDSYYSAPFEKGLRILNLFAQGQELSLEEVSTMARVSKTSAYRFCNTLARLGYLKKDPRTKLLELGTKAFTMGNGLIRGFDLYRLVKSFLDEACNAHHLAVDSSVFDGESMAVLYRREVGGTLTYRLPMMTNALTCTALGKAMLAFLPAEARLTLVTRLPRERRTEKTLTIVEEIMENLRLTKERGYALNDEEFFPGFLAIAAPFVNLNTQIVAGAVCFDFAGTDHSIDGIQRDYGEAIVKLGADISRALPD